MKPIETVYKGYRFRSRLEARWAVFFDVLGIEWEYEPEGFDLGGGVRYLPDFKTTSPTGMVAWYEIKPKGVTYCEKFALFEKWLVAASPGAPSPASRLLSGDPLDVIAVSLPPEHEHASVVRVCPRCGNVAPPDYGFAWMGNDWEYGCERCDFDTPGGGGSPSESGLLAEVSPHKGFLILSDSELARYLHKVRMAAETARGARFEFGESGVRRV